MFFLVFHKYEKNVQYQNKKKYGKNQTNKGC